MSVALSAKPQSAPSDAFRFAAPLAFRDAAGDEKQSPDEHRVTVTARTPGVVDHWFWDRIIHDMSGCRHRDRVPFDYRHRSDEVLGYADAITADDNGLVVTGPLQSVSEGDRASEVIARGRMGHPYEASIYWDENDATLEYLDDGFIATVNGQQIEGPCVIARQWTLRAVAITPHGVDKTTHTQFSADGQSDVSITLQKIGNPMTKDVTKDSEPELSATEVKSLFGRMMAFFDSHESKEDEPAAPTKDDARNELKRYTERFGTERGAEYFQDSVPYADAIEKEVDHLRETLATRDSELKAEREKMASLNLGEQEAIDTGKTKDETPKKTFASRIRFAGSASGN